MFWKWFLSRRPSRAIEASQRASNRLEDATRRLQRLEDRLLKLEQGTVRLLSQTAAHVDRAKLVAEAVAEDIKIAERAVEQAGQAMEVLRTEHEADAVAVETLTSRIKEYQALSEANVAMSNHRRGQMASGPEQL